jgi:hypothetical protein
MVFEEDYLDDSVTIIRIPGETGPRGPRGFPFIIRGVLEDPSELSGQYEVFDGEDLVLLQGLEPGDPGYVEPVISQAYIIQQDLWVFTPDLYWVNVGPIRATVEVGDTIVLNPNESPVVRDVGDDFDTVLEFDIPRAPTVTLGAVNVVNPDEEPDVVFDGEDGDVIVSFDLPRTANFTVDQVAILNNDQSPDVSINVVDGDVGFTFDLPQAKQADLGTVTIVNPDENPTITDSGDVNQLTLDFALPRAPAVTLGAVNVVDSDQTPDVTFTTTNGDVEVGFDLPRAPTFTVGNVTVGNNPADASVTDVGLGGDVELDIKLPRTTINVGTTTVVNPNQFPSVINSGTDGEAVLEFDLPRAPSVELGVVVTVNPDQNPDVFIFDGEDGDAVIDFDLPRAPTFTVGTVTTGSAGSSVVVDDVGLDGDIVLDFTIPKGDTGLGIEEPFGDDGSLLVADSTTDSGTSWTRIPEVDGLNFNTLAGLEPEAEGELVWDDDAGTIDIGLNQGVALRIGQDVFYRVQASENIAKGQLVAASGTIGSSGIILVALARPEVGGNPIPSKYIMGLAATDIDNGDQGYVVHFGKLRKVDTSAFDEGDILFADPEVPGGLTITMPEAPNWKTTVAIVITKSTNNGLLLIRPTYGSSLDEDELVELSSPENDQILAFDGEAGRFSNITLAIDGGAPDTVYS